MKAKDTSVAGLTKGVEFLFKKNGVEYLKGSGSFVNEHEVKVQLNDGGETSVVGKNILIATGSEATPFPGLEIDEKRVVSSTGAIALEKVPEKLIVIGGGIIGLEMASVWSRLGSKVTVVEFLNQIGGPGMDSEIAKQTQKILKKQGIDFKLSTKVVDGDKSGETIKLNVDAAKGGKAESVGAPSTPLPPPNQGNPWGSLNTCSNYILEETGLLTKPCVRNIARCRRRPRCHWPSAIHGRIGLGEHWAGAR